MCMQGVDTVVYLTASGSEAFVLRIELQHKFQHKINLAISRNVSFPLAIIYFNGKHILHSVGDV